MVNQKVKFSAPIWCPSETRRIRPSSALDTRLSLDCAADNTNFKIEMQGGTWIRPKEKMWIALSKIVNIFKTTGHHRWTIWFKAQSVLGVGVLAANDVRSRSMAFVWGFVWGGFSAKYGPRRRLANITLCHRAAAIASRRVLTLIWRDGPKKWRTPHTKILTTTALYAALATR